MSLARLFKMSFGNIYILGRLVNLIVYVTTMTFAIRKIKKGKILLSVIGLLPTVMFLSSTISYDPFVLSFISSLYSLPFKENDAFETLFAYLPIGAPKPGIFTS